MQPTMLQPVGGMDRIAHAIYEQVKPSVRLNSRSRAIRRDGDRVRIEHERGRRQPKPIIASCTLPAELAQTHPEAISRPRRRPR